MNFSNCKIVVVAPGTFDMLGIKRVFSKRKVHCDTVFVDGLLRLEEALLEISPDNLPAIVVDYSDNLDVATDCTGYINAELEYPVIGIFETGDGALISRELGNGLSGYVVKNESGDHFEVLYALIQSESSRQHRHTQFERYKQDILQLERQRNAVLNASLTLISYHLPDTKIVWSNAIEEGEDKKPYDFLEGRYCKEIWKHGGLPNGKCPVATAVETGDSVEAEVVTLDGYAMLQRSYPIKDMAGKVIGVMASTLDMSAVSPAQEAMRTAARIQASATLAGGIAHKFNNLMSGVMGNVSLAMQDAGENTHVVEYLREIEQAAVQAGELSDQLLAFARGGKYLPKTLDLREVVAEVLKTEKSRFSDSITIVTHLTESVSKVEANAAQMSLLVTQLLVNAAEAIEVDPVFEAGGGEIVVSVKDEDVTGALASIRPWLSDGTYVCLTVEDNGCGMSPELKKKIFEPFFTTKKKGRGLGLAGVYGISRSHDGNVSVESEKGAGTKVIVHIPVSNVEEVSFDSEPVEDAPKQTEVEPTNVVSLERGTETVLVVDDESMLRKAVKRTLTGLGYKVFVADSGDKAVEMARSYAGVIDLTLLDMIMPGLDGMETYKALKKEYPEMEIIVMSGYDKETYGDSLLQAGASAFMQKPITMKTLVKEIRKVLDEKALY